MLKFWLLLCCYNNNRSYYNNYNSEYIIIDTVIIKWWTSHAQINRDTDIDLYSNIPANWVPSKNEFFIPVMKNQHVALKY